jgi:gluconolactonase
MSKSKILFSILILLIFTACSTTQIEFTKWELVADQQNFPEGITFDHNGTLYSSNCHGNWITRITDNSIDTFLIASDSTFNQTNGLFALRDGTIYATDYGSGSILKMDKSGYSGILIDGYQGTQLNRPNDITVDQYGNIFFTDPKSYGEFILDGRVFYYNVSDDTLKMIQDQLAFPNGIGISPATKRLYVCESAKSRILSFKINDDGTLDDKQVFIELPGGDPDGFNFDMYGNMYVAHFGGGKIFVISPNGKVLKEVNTPGKQPSNVEFAGEDLKTFFITEDETNSIYKCKVNFEGFDNNK